MYKVEIVTSIALGIILMIGGAVAAGVLYSHLGYVALSCLSAIPAGIALIVMVVRRGQADTEGSRLDSRNVVEIGSQKEPLNADRIQEEFKKVSERKDVEALIIFGDGNVRFDHDPGIVKMNPKKLILVGARIVPAENGLDEDLLHSGDWLVTGSRKDEATTCTKQLEVFSIQEALYSRRDNQKKVSFGSKKFDKILFTPCRSGIDCG